MCEEPWQQATSQATVLESCSGIVLTDRSTFITYLNESKAGSRSVTDLGPGYIRAPYVKSLLVLCEFAGAGCAVEWTDSASQQRIMGPGSPQQSEVPEHQAAVPVTPLPPCQPGPTPQPESPGPGRGLGRDCQSVCAGAAWPWGV